MREVLLSLIIFQDDDVIKNNNIDENNNIKHILNKNKLCNILIDKQTENKHFELGGGAPASAIPILKNLANTDSSSSQLLTSQSPHLYTIVAPSPPYPPLYIGKGITDGNNVQHMIFGYPLPNNLPSQAFSWPSPWSILNPTTLFDLSTIGGINHEVVIALCILNGVYCSGNVTIIVNWYRNRDNYNISCLSLTQNIPYPGYYNNIGAAFWIGWLSQFIEQEFYSAYAQMEIVENGNYYVIITLSGGYSGTYIGNFAIKGIPAWTFLSNPTLTTFDWKVCTSDYFNTSNYIQAGICNQPFTNGQSSPPSGIVAANNATANNYGAATTGTITGQTPSQTYTLYGFAQAANGLYYQCGSDSITLLPDNPYISYYIEGGYNVAWEPYIGAISYYLGCEDYPGGGNGHTYNTINTNYTLSDLGFGITYNLDVEIYTGQYLIISPFAPATTLPQTPGVNVDNISVLATGSTYIQIEAPTLSGNYDAIRIYRYASLTDLNNNNPIDYKDCSGGGYQEWDGLTLGTIYYFNAKSHYYVNSTTLWSLNYSSYITAAASNRPNNFSWTTGHAPIQGQAVNNLLASDWNSLTSKINSFRTYKGLSTITFTSAVTGNIFMANMFNQARNGIYDMNSSGLPGTKVGKSTNPTNPDNIDASDLIALVSCLNAIS